MRHGTVLMLLLLSLVAGPGSLQAVSFERTAQMRGDAAYAYMGYALTATGDLNGDGYPDLAVGVPGGGPSQAGMVRIYLGGPAMDTVADLVLYGEDASSTINEKFGAAVAMGDFNGDGYDDLAVGAPKYPWGGSLASYGRVFLYFGGSAMDSVVDAVFSGGLNSEDFGRAVALGDLDGDGYADLVVGDPLSDHGALDAGTVYLFYGGFFLDTASDAVWDGDTANAELGHVLTTGDLNGDGLEELVVGAPYAPVGGVANVGEVYIHLGGPAFSVTPFRVLKGDAGSMFGRSLAVGDVNGDGFGDLVVGVIGGQYAGVSSGAVYVYHGGVDLDTVVDRILGSLSGEAIGSSVAVGDLNCDGVNDVVAGDVAGTVSGSTTPGQVFAFYGGDPMDTVADVYFGNGESGDDLGYAVAAADFHGDGCADLVAGARWKDRGSLQDAGSVDLYNFYRFRLLSPSGGDTWPVGALRTVRWIGRDRASLYLSVDGGHTWTQLASGLGGSVTSDTQAFVLRVPHTPTRYARVRLVAEDAPRFDHPGYFAQSDSFFQIKASVVLLAFQAQSLANGVRLSWRTETGPEDLAGYRLYREDGGRRILLHADLLRDTGFTVQVSHPTTFVLAAVNGLGQELELGRLPFARHALTLVREGGQTVVHMYVPALRPGQATPVELSLLDGTGRRVRLLVRGTFTPGFHRVPVPLSDVRSGHYFLRLQAEGYTRTLRVIWNR